MWSAPITSVADSRKKFLSRLDRMASHSLCTLRSQRRRWTTQHSVPAGSLLLAGQVQLLLGHCTRFQRYMSSSSSVFIWRTAIGIATKAGR